MNSLCEKTAVVLGASAENGIGAAIAGRLKDAGADVRIAARNAERLAATAANLGVAHQACDARDEDALADLMAVYGDEGHGLDIAVYAAGVNHYAPIAKFDPAQATEVLDTQFTGALLFIKHATRVMNDGGSIILISSLTARLPAPGTAVYAGTKAAMDHAVRVAALEYADRNIRVNAIAPGLQRTDMTEALFENPGLERAAVRETPLGRLGQPGEIGTAPAWLAADDCFMTGAVLTVADGAELRRIPTFEEMAG